MSSKARWFGVAVALIAIGGAIAWFVHRPPAGTVAGYDYATAFELLDTSAGAPVLKLADVAGKTSEAVRAALGAPMYCEDSLYSHRCRYQPGDTEIVFIDGRADWITVTHLGDTPLKPEILNRIGLATTVPTEQHDGELVWSGLSGLHEVRAESEAGGEDRVEFIRVKVRTP